MTELPEKMILFHRKVDDIEFPEQFTYPHCYDPHPLAMIASEQLQAYLESTTKIDHNYGLRSGALGLVIGKMFGVLVVQNSEGTLGFLAAFSGKLADSNNHTYFVPPIFDTLDPAGFYKQGEEVLNGYNHKIDILESSETYLSAVAKLDTLRQQSHEAIAQRKALNKSRKKERRHQRHHHKEVMTPSQYEHLLTELSEQSIGDNFALRDLSRRWEHDIEAQERIVNTMRAEIDTLKDTRKKLSHDLQKRLFDQYHFINIEGKKRGLAAIFDETVFKVPPAGAGECAAPKLLQYAFLHKLTPIAMAEFWWGASPKSQIRHHRHYYPACRGKCEPILSHMLSGMNVEDNPLLEAPRADIKIDVLYEDDHLIAVHKPHEFLSVPGRNTRDSVASRLEEKYADRFKTIVVHRLDMSTSGVMIFAKDQRTHRILQQQFIKKTIHKRYVAVLDGGLTSKEGVIDLPLRGDIEDRPRQLVCHEHGKPSRTRYQVVHTEDNKTRIHFFPVTGRTHQLRVHAAHPDGLGIPIVGDDLYGKKSSRLLLHAEEIRFIHPDSKEEITILCPAPF